jgi:ferric-dicitrate binding protein FerR (iron transport regulator)
MKKKLKTGKFTGREWEEMASALSGEKDDRSELLGRFIFEGNDNIAKQWKGLKMIIDEKEINVDKAWNNLNSRLSETGSVHEKNPARIIFMRSTLMKVAAVTLILIGIGSVLFYTGISDSLSKRIIITTGNDQKNYTLSLPDGSNIFLNRNTELAYHANFGKHSRKVSLRGEAFFEIASNAAKPFTIDAGEASVKVIGTSFNVITSNSDAAVEVFVKTGKVMLSDNSGTQKLVLEPGYVGTMDSKVSGKSLNSNRNYMAWNTGSLVYDGQTLDVVFKDLKKVYNMDIIADDPDILNDTWYIPTIDNQPQETIIRLICTSFNLSFTKDGDAYHLSKK